MLLVHGELLFRFHPLNLVGLRRKSAFCTANLVMGSCGLHFA